MHNPCVLIMHFSHRVENSAGSICWRYERGCLGNNVGQEQHCPFPQQCSNTGNVSPDPAAQRGLYSVESLRQQTSSLLQSQSKNTPFFFSSSAFFFPPSSLLALKNAKEAQKAIFCGFFCLAHALSSSFTALKGIAQV